MCPAAKIVKAVAGRVTSRDDITLLMLRSDVEAEAAFFDPAMVHARERINPGWDAEKHPVDLWGERRGRTLEARFDLVPGVSFIRAPLVMAIRTLFNPTNASLAQVRHLARLQTRLSGLNLGSAAPID